MLPHSHDMLRSNADCFARIGPGSQKRLSDIKSALEQLARRFLPCPGEIFEPLPPPALLQTITDELLVVLSDTVAAVATEVQPPPSGKALLRLLAWLAADARGATTVLDKATAFKVGKRMDYQAQSVRAALRQATCTANEDRAALAEQGAKLRPAEVSAAHAKIDNAEQRVYDFHSRDVYIGFHELDELLPRPVPPAVTQPCFLPAACASAPASRQPQGFSRPCRPI